MILPPAKTHQKGEAQRDLKKSDLITKNTSLAVETFGGRVHVEWNPNSQ